MYRNNAFVHGSRVADKFVVRLPDGMRERIAVVARDHHRSMNSEIIARLERSLNDPAQAEEDINMIDLPVDPWTPVIGMLVTFRKGQYAGQARLIGGIEYYEGEYVANLTGHGALVRFKDLKPFLVV